MGSHTYDGCRRYMSVLKINLLCKYKYNAFSPPLKKKDTTLILKARLPGPSIPLASQRYKVCLICHGLLPSLSYFLNHFSNVCSNLSH